MNHRLRVNTEKKAKVVAAAWGAEFIKFLATLPYTVAILHQDDLRKRMNRITATWWWNECFEIMDVHPKTLVQHSSTPPNRNDDLCLLFCINPSSMQCRIDSIITDLVTEKMKTQNVNDELDQTFELFVAH